MFNKETSRKEVKYFKTKKPSKYYGYVDKEKGKITTWMGDDIGEILSSSETKRRGFTGDKVYSVYFKGINGKLYHGYGSEGSAITFKERKRR